MNSQAHIDAIFRKAASRLHFLRILKKSGLKPHHLLHFYLTVITCSSVLFGGVAPLSHKSSVRDLGGHTTPGTLYYLRTYPPTIGMPYTFAFTLPKLPSLHDRREHINGQFFRSISSSCISSLLMSPGTMTSLPDCELHLSIHVRLVGYTHKTIHILHQLLFITLSVTNVICDFECFITLLFPCIAHFHFIIVLFLF